jgi:hypothetical protein
VLDLVELWTMWGYLRLFARAGVLPPLLDGVVTLHYIRYITLGRAITKPRIGPGNKTKVLVVPDLD